MKSPCIRGLKEFKKGCPEKGWDGKEGCPAWRVMSIGRRDSGETDVIGKCLDQWNFKLLFDACKLLEGNQQATEGNRNMTALHSLVAVGAKTPEDLYRVATKHLIQSRDQLLLEATGD